MSDRFWVKVEKTESCWLWTASLNNRGYGIFRWQQKNVLAHRWSWEQAHGPIPEGMQIDHVYSRGCRYKNCVNPEHLEPVTGRENARRGADSRNTDTVCKNGHLRDENNTYISPDGTRRCMTCQHEANEAREGVKPPRAKLTPEQVFEIRTMDRTNRTQRSIATQFNVTQGTIWRILSGKAWT